MSSAERAVEDRAPASVDADPFDLPGRGEAAALCLHGLTGTPYEVRSLGEALSAAGVRALGPLLPGHGASPEALARTSNEAWVEAARGHLATLRERHAVVFGVGMSMGGLVTLLLAAEGGLDAVVSVGAPLRLRQPIGALLPILRWLVPMVPKRGGSDIRDPEARRRHPSYPVMPLAAVRQLQHLQRRVRAALPRVSVPLLVAHGAHDRTANPADAREIHARVRSEAKQLRLFGRSGHLVPVDHDAAELAEAVTAFLTARPSTAR